MTLRLASIIEPNETHVKSSAPHMPTFKSVFGDVCAKFSTNDGSNSGVRSHEDFTMEMVELP